MQIINNATNEVIIDNVTATTAMDGGLLVEYQGKNKLTPIEVPDDTLYSQRTFIDANNIDNVTVI
jgi:UDP-N-acetylglucosamine pyrophosphorylase